MVTLITTSIATLVSLVATRLVLRYARKRLVDPVTHRSSHRIAKPRGGGLGLVIGLLVAWVPMVVWYTEGVAAGTVAALAGAIVGMSALGWWDDHVNLPARLRLPLQLALVALVLYAIGLPDQVLLTGTWALSPLGPLALAWWFIPVAILGGAWMVNLTNFMDGIDGIAASQGAIGSVALALLLPAEAVELRLLLVACAAACVGFLVWNRPPAKIFMGDVGSTALGLVFAIGILGGIRHGIAVEHLLLPLAPFIADAGCTLLRRAWLREPIHQPHRTHLYQRLAKQWKSHLPATGLFAGLALLGTGLALAGASGFIPPLAGTAVFAMIWTGLVLYGRRRCPAGQEQPT